MIADDMRPIVYELFVRHFSNFTDARTPWGSRAENGCGTFNAINDAALESIARMGVTHLWLAGVLRHATQTAHEGMPANPAAVVKGIAGSPYAVTDYFDVDPDLAEDVPNRLEEFCALLERCRRWGMAPMIDFIPNHVSRCYASVVCPEQTLGQGDNTSVFFSRDNAFYYLDPCNSDNALMLPSGEFFPEHGHGRVTGNNAATWTPGAFDWFETVKLNYGSDYRHGPYAADALPGVLSPHSAVPRTWQRMDAVLAYWQKMGVGGFRCDMAHMVPMPFWRWSIANSRLRDASVFFMAEAYNDHMKLTARDVHEALIDAGFGGVYHAGAYQALRALYEGGTWANDLDALNMTESATFRKGVRYVENHDEPRLASPQFWGGKGETAARALMAAQYAATAAPVLFYNGQEAGERAEGPGGYGGDNGRTSIFDYTGLPRLQHWTNGGRYDGALMSQKERKLRDFCTRLLPLLQHPALSAGDFYGLNWSNMASAGFGRLPGETVSGHLGYAFLRHNRKARATVLVICNFSTEAPLKTAVHIPRNALEWAGKKPGCYRFHNLLEPDAAPLVATDAELESPGLQVCIPAGDALMLEWR